jgi:hypothetical protein
MLTRTAMRLTMVADIRRYMHDIVVFLRTHRLVRKGVSPKAAKDFEFLVRALCVLHDHDFVTPSIVAVAARKIFPLKIEMCEPQDEPTLQYGSDIKLVSKWIQKWDQELIVENVLDNASPPV